MKKNLKKPSIQELESEKNKLYVSKDNPRRLKEIIDKLNFLYYGIKC